MLGHRLRRWPNIKPTLVQRLEFAGYLCAAHIGVQGQKVIKWVQLAGIDAQGQDSWINFEPSTHYWLSFGKRPIIYHCFSHVYYFQDFLLRQTNENQ